jgi:hypothetical protein
MSYARDNLPKSFQPYQKLTVCSNSLIGGSHIVEISGTLPLIIGKGEKPQVWLQAISNPETKEFVLIVENSISKFPTVQVNEVNGALVISVQGKKVLSVRETSGDEAIVDVLDLRPIGLNLYGDSKGMNGGGGSFSGNAMSGGGVLLGFVG